ncbi:glycerol-3-phosphate ABC transporter substrate-binding protein, partial [Citrobacter freundii ATCC 8090 = MTCC 1658 = NBRC 12681]
SIDTGYVATRKSAYEEEIMKQYVKDFPAAAVARDQLEYGHAEFSTHNNGKVTKALNDNLQAVITGKASAAEALKKAQEEADKVLAPFNK